MILGICIVVFLLSLFGLLSDSDKSAREMFEYNVAERRHEELMESLDKLNKESEDMEESDISDSNHKVIRRRILKDKNGNVLAEEIIEE